MKKLALAFCLSLYTLFVNAQTPKTTPLKNKVVEIACGECKFNMKGKSCDLAIRIDGKAYFVDGKNIDDFGDAHDEKHGFCNVISKAKVIGKIVDNRFQATAIKLIAEKK